MILAVPAYVAAELLAEACPEAALEMRSIEYASVATVALSYPAQALERHARRKRVPRRPRRGPHDHRLHLVLLPSGRSWPARICC